ncbi:alginate lyase family protein [Asticcacaulis sp. EMRT-3]|uniref:alginate lyase family protein n=1 Tax=Asticcacaulis sp. EMRT-3 TaxID=3040349 RepID=UPI0024AF0737|nr:alginate lyase family protein [Asticcacaulis sp. EMRT-3]MDI7773919.1 alginate lyase family protein [Asticcacaulis sp. EMRT-3]
MRLPLSAFGFLAASVFAASLPAVSAPVCDGSHGYAAAFDGRTTFLWRSDALMSEKAAIAADPGASPAYKALIRQANADLSKGPWSVTDKTHQTPSGDPHDYMSIAPYWWPDPAKPDGLPYINRDGRINPERATAAFDRTRMGEMSDAVETLALAYFYSGEQKYAERAALILRTWFLDPKTRMNPNFNFAQGVPGRVAGRSYGIIDGAGFMSVTEAVGLLQPSGALSQADMDGLHDWFGQFTDWMTTSDNGVTERKAANNHGIWYDLQLTDYALFAGKTDLAHQVAADFTKRRLEPQMATDGSLPRELARTRSFHYSTWTMQAVYDMAALGRCTGVDIWDFDDGQGRSLRHATDFIAGYAGHESDWHWQEIAMNTGDLYEALLRAAWGYDDPALDAKADIYRKTYAASRINLIYPPLPRKKGQ